MFTFEKFILADILNLYRKIIKATFKIKPNNIIITKKQKRE